MEIEVAECTVRLNQKGNVGLTEIVKAGPDAMTPGEIEILRAMHDLDGEGAEACCIGNLKVVGKIDRSLAEERELLRLKYGPHVVQHLFPQPRHIPTKISDLILPPESLSAKQKATRSPDEISNRKKELREELNAAGVKTPPGNISEANLQALLDDHLASVGA